MKYIRSFFAGLVFLLIFFATFYSSIFAHEVHASESQGTINSTYYQARICRDVPCTSALAGTINFRPAGVTAITIDDNDGVDGIAWGNDLGWITFDPTGPEGVTIASTTGVLSGYAWAQVGGWLNMSPTGYGVTINSSGEFTGYGWVGGVNGGWVKFDCSGAGIAANQCVKTDWRPAPVRGLISTSTASTTPTGGGGTTGSTRDVCPNLYGAQTVVPPGYTQDQGGFCWLANVDYCPNVEGVQNSVPPNLVLNSSGVCVAPIEIPNTGLDMCPNLASVQRQIPTGYVLDENNFCVPENTDYCPNFEGNQTFIPDNYVINDGGQCVERIDIPANPLNPTENGRDVLALPFIPSSWWQAYDVPWISSIFEPERSAQQSTRPYVDLVSVLVAVTTSALAAILLLLFVWLLQKNVRGIVFNGDIKNTISGASVEFIRIADGAVKHAITNAKGVYKIRLKQGTHYRVRVYNKNQMATAPELIDLNKIGKTTVNANLVSQDGETAVVKLNKY